MICKVKRTVESYSMFVRAGRVVVALSGGADSMALLNVLYKLRDEYGITVEACHVNHGIRGASADSDEAFVVDECKKLGIELHLLHADVPSLAKQRGLGLEECGRQVRYEFFSQLGDCVVATAHTLSDRCETLLLNETRGASLKGLCSIPAVRGNIIRPLIDCTREDVENFCAENSIPFVTDETNADDTYSRNRIRLNVIPELKKINPSFEQALARLISTVSEDDDYFSELTDRVLSQAEIDCGYNTDMILQQHPAVRRRVLAKIIKTCAGVTPELIHLNKIEDILHGGKTEIIGNTVVCVKNKVLYVNPAEEDVSEWEYDFSSFNAMVGERKIKATVFNRNDLPPKQFVHNKVLDCDGIRGRCVLRNRRAGDKIRLAGSSCTKTLKKLMNEKHIEGRNSVIIMADEDGVLWVENIGCADRVKITKETRRVLLIEEE